MPALATVELARAEVDLLLSLVRGRHAELERVLQNLEETEGMDATKWSVRRQLLPQIEVHEDLIVKLEAAGKELA